MSLEQIPRDLVATLRIEADHAANPPTQLVVAFDGGREVHKPAPDQDMADLLTEAADEIERRRACWCYHAGAGEWRPIKTAPKDRYFLACVTPERSEEKLMDAIFGSDRPKVDRRHIIVASIRPKQRKGRVHMSVTGQPFWATHWMPLPFPPEAP